MGVFERVLVIDQEPELRESLELILTSEGYEVTAVTNAADAIERIGTTSIDIVLCDIGMPGLDGFDLLPQIARAAPAAPIVLTSPRALEEGATEALQRGAFDCIPKPPSPPEVVLALRRASQHARMWRRSQLLRRDVSSVLGERPIVAASQPMIDLLELLERAAAFEGPVLITGARGTGKEVVARAVHAQSNRREAPFVAVGCTASSAEDLQRDLFGQAGERRAGRRRARRGLFWEANGGSLYLDEVCDLPATLQLELLRVLREEMIRPVGESKPQQVDIRVLAGSARGLDHRNDLLDADLRESLSAIRIHVPALTERREDIPLLVDHFLQHFRKVLGKPVRRIADDALAMLVGHAWPGNVRELENVIERAIMAAEDDRITPAALSAQMTSAGEHSAAADLSLRGARRRSEAEAICRALKVTKGNRTHAAKRLAISHRALLYKLKEYGIK